MTSVYECDNNNISENEEHLNFMAGVSYFPKDPILELKLVLLSTNGLAESPRDLNTFS